MPRGLVRYEHTGSFHFLNFSCFHRNQHLGTAERRGNRSPENLRYREKVD